jgi:hypothetical protein
VTPQSNDLELLRDTLRGQAESCALAPDLAATVHRRAHRHVVRRNAALAGAAVMAVVAVAVGGNVVRAAHRGIGASTTVAPPDWPARGAAAHDRAFVGAAVSAWDAGTGTRHTSVDVLFAGKDSIGPAAILVGRDAQGRLHVAGLVGGATETVPTVVADDHLATSPIVAASLVHTASGRRPVVVLVTSPAFRTVTWSTPGAAVAPEDATDDLIDGLDIHSASDARSVPTSAELAGSDGSRVTVAIG